MSYIETHPHEPISVEDRALQLHYTEGYFHHVFKKITGYTPIQYVTIRKIELAKRLLATTDWSISRVEDAAGKQLQYFSSLFKQQTGVSPSVFRKHIH
jgi:AraC-like DNA-binding protein